MRAARISRGADLLLAWGATKIGGMPVRRSGDTCDTMIGAMLGYRPTAGLWFLVPAI